MKCIVRSLFVLVMLASVPFILKAQQKTVMVNPEVAFTSSNLPIVVINTNGKPIQNEPKIIADMGIIDNGEGKRNNLTDPFNHYKGKIAIEIRGNSSQQFPKKQYGFSTVDSLGQDLDAALLGFPAEDSWILSAQYNEKTLMRDVITFDIARKMGRYASRSKYCEVVLNGDYIGVYMLFEKIKRDKNRVDISKMTPADSAGDALTGGYIFQIDRENDPGNGGWYSSFTAYPGTYKKPFYQYVVPKTEEITAVQKSYLKKYVYDFEQKMNSPLYADTAAGYPKLIDVASFVDVFILNELSRNVDAYRLSNYMYKNRDSKGGKLVAGPIWDYGLAYGNANYNNAWETTGINVEYMSTDPQVRNQEPLLPPFWWYKLYLDKNFKVAAAKRWKSLRTNILQFNAIFAVMDSISNLLTEARDRNFARWPVMGKYVWPNYYVGPTYNDEILFMQGWIIKRFNWLDDHFAPLTDTEQEDYVPSEFSLSQNYPNPFNPATTIKYSVPVSGHVNLKVFNSLGAEAASVINEYQMKGSYSVEFDARHLPSGIYYYRLETASASEVKKMILLK